MLKFAIFFGVAAALLAQEETPDKRLRESSEVFKEVMATPDKAIPRDLLEKSQCVAIVPGMKKAAFLVGGQYGRGFVTCREGASWSGPAAVRLAGGSFGLQLGADSTDLVLLVMNKRGMERLFSDKFTIGADAAAAAGPVGRTTAANTDILLRAEILSWSRSRGAFAGVALDGTVVSTDNSENEKLYGKKVNNKEIILGEVHAPAGAEQLLSELKAYPESGNGADRSSPR
jgi:lipid-binding SYLF domain-containing protein